MYWSATQFELLHNLLEGGHSGHNGADGLRLAQFGFPRRFAIDLMSLRKSDPQENPRKRAGGACQS